MGQTFFPAVDRKSVYSGIPCEGTSFESAAKRCAMGDVDSMFWMFEEFAGRLSAECRELEGACLADPSEENTRLLERWLEHHEDDNIHLQASHLWLKRAAIYGSKRAEDLLDTRPFYREYSFLSTLFQIPGKERRRECCGSVMRRIGFLDFDEKISYTMESLDRNGIYIGSRYVSYDGPDESGFGMEDEYDYYFFDEFFRLLYMIPGWSERDISNNRDRIDSFNIMKRDSMQRERDQFWNRYGNEPEMERYRMSAIEMHGPLIVDGTLIAYMEDLKLYGNTGETAVVPDGVSVIAQEAFKECKNIVSVKLPSSIKSIGRYAFSGCDKLQEFSWPRSVSKIEERVFFHCHGLERVEIPDTVTEIREGAFLACRSLESIKIPGSVKRLDKNIFKYCETLREIILPEELEDLREKII